MRKRTFFSLLLGERLTLIRHLHEHNFIIPTIHIMKTIDLQFK
jgi:hypothetical protein